VSSGTTSSQGDSASRARSPGEVQDGAPKSGSSAKIRIQDLTKQFSTKDGTLTAIDNLSLDIPSGRFFMIV
jgi:NitT/TauT family transport system ATP-binding protein